MVSSRYVCAKQTNPSISLLYWGKFFPKNTKFYRKATLNDKAEIQVKTREQKKHDFDHLRTGCSAILDKMSYLVM